MNIPNATQNPIAGSAEPVVKLSYTTPESVFLDFAYPIIHDLLGQGVNFVFIQADDKSQKSFNKFVHHNYKEKKLHKEEKDLQKIMMSIFKKTSDIVLNEAISSNDQEIMKWHKIAKQHAAAFTFQMIEKGQLGMALTLSEARILDDAGEQIRAMRESAKK